MHPAYKEKISKFILSLRKKVPFIVNKYNVRPINVNNDPGIINNHFGA